MAVRIKKPTALTVVSLALPAAMLTAPSFAQPLNLDFAQLSYTSQDYNAITESLSGYELELSKRIDNNFFGFFEYFEVGETISTQDIDITSWRFGAGYTESIDSKTDFIATFMYIDKELDSVLTDVSETGFGVSVGVNYQAMDALELTADFRMENVGDSDVAYTFGAEYTFSDYLSAVGSLAHADDGEFISIGARYSF